jgi:hypothetical protein
MNHTLFFAMSIEKIQRDRQSTIDDQLSERIQDVVALGASVEAMCHGMDMVTGSMPYSLITTRTASCGEAGL